MRNTTQAEFDEQLYLLGNPEVADAVARGKFKSGWDHYQSSGRAEGRPANAQDFVRDHARQVDELKDSIAEREHRLHTLSRQAAEQAAILDEIRRSAPVRIALALRRLLLLPKVVARRVAKVAWWTVTLQLPQRLRARRAMASYPDPMKPRNGQDKPHFSPPQDDYCFAVPFKYPLQPSEKTPSLAVVCHMFYPELLEEFKAYLANIPFPFDFYLTTDSEEKAAAIRAGLEGWDKGAVDVRLAPNRGRDIAPKLLTCRDVYDKYEFFLHIHSKKSPHADVLEHWRPYLLGTLLGSPEIVMSVFDAFEADPKLGMIAPEHFDPVRAYIGWGWNIRAANRFAGELGITFPDLDKVDFPSGSMLWGRSRALQPLLDRNLRTADFAAEARQIDGTVAHVIERMYYFICEKAGYHWIKIVRPDLSKRKYDVLDIQDRAELGAMIVGNQYGLLAPRKPGARRAAIMEPGLHQNWRSVHANSDLRHLDFARFCDELRRHIAGEPSAIDFDEAFYLAAHPDVAREVGAAQISCGYVHYCIAGRAEGRIYSDSELRRRFGLAPNYPSGALAPADKTEPAEAVVLEQLPDAPRPMLLILFSHLQEQFFFAGYTEFFKDYVPVMERFDRVVLSVQSTDLDPRLAKQHLDRIEVIPATGIAQLKHRPHMIIAFNAHLAHLAHRMMPSLPERVVYYCQDFEGGFFPYSSDYVIGERAVANSRNLVVSTRLLRDFLVQRGLIKDQNVYVTKPRIEVLDVARTRTNRLFFYYRPESFHRRNLPEMVREAVARVCERYPDHEIFLGGTVSTAYSYRVSGTQVYVLSKLPKQDYMELVSSCDVVVSMIYSAHPGVIQFQAAASGIPTVTNVFENRDAALLRRISRNIVPYDPVRQDLIDCIDQAMKMPKGERDFDETLYSGEPGDNLVPFHEDLLGAACARTTEQLAA